MSKLNIIPVFVPHYGCPNDCIFCNQRKITNQDYIKDFEETRKSIVEYLNYFSNKDNETQIAFYGGSFTGLPMDVMKEFLSIGKGFIDQGAVNSLRLSTRPDYIDENILNILKSYGVSTIELGVQSLVDEVLVANQRNHLSDVVYSSSKLIKEFGFKLGLQQMLGLYKSNFEMDLYTTDEFVKIGPEFARVYPTLVIKDSYLEKLYLDGKYKPYSLDETIKLCKEIYCTFYKNGIDIIRIGLQPTDNITLGKDVVAGPFHPSIRQLTIQELYKDAMDEVLKNFSEQDIDVYVDNGELNYFVGNKGANKKYLMEKYKIKKFKVHGTKDDKITIQSNKDTLELDMDKFLKSYRGLIRWN